MWRFNIEVSAVRVQSCSLDILNHTTYLLARHSPFFNLCSHQRLSRGVFVQTVVNLTTGVYIHREMS